jgi:hypothetical protein
MGFGEILLIGLLLWIVYQGYQWRQRRKAALEEVLGASFEEIDAIQRDLKKQLGRDYDKRKTLGELKEMARKKKLGSVS